MYMYRLYTPRQCSDTGALATTLVTLTAHLVGALHGGTTIHSTTTHTMVITTTHGTIGTGTTATVHTMTHGIDHHHAHIATVHTTTRTTTLTNIAVLNITTQTVAEAIRADTLLAYLHRE